VLALRRGDHCRTGAALIINPIEEIRRVGRYPEEIERHQRDQQCRDEDDARKHRNPVGGGHFRLVRGHSGEDYPVTQTAKKSAPEDGYCGNDWNAAGHVSPFEHIESFYGCISLTDLKGVLVFANEQRLASLVRCLEPDRRQGACSPAAFRALR
jgi:hypothetical protein